MMKYLTRFLRPALTAALVFCLGAAVAFGAQQPCVVLKASGVQNQYTLRLDAFGSNFESVQFDIVIDRLVQVPQVEWRDDSPAHFQEVRAGQADGKTTLTVYIDRLRPIANSGSVELCDLTFSQALPASAFSGGAEMIALDRDQAETVYQNPALSVIGGSSGSSSGGPGGAGGSRDDDGGNDSSTLGWNDVSRDITESGGRKTLAVRVRGGKNISQDLFRQAADRELLLRLNYGKYSWAFDTAKGVSIPAGRIYYDLSVDAIGYRNLSAAVEGSDIAQFATVHSGALPCAGVLSWPVGEEHAGKTVYLSWYNENETRLEYRASMQVGPDGMVEVPLSRGGKYVISLRNVWGQPAAAPGAAAGTSQAPAPAGSAPEVTVPPEDQVAAPSEEPVPASVSSLPPEAEIEKGEGGWPGWALPLVGGLVLLAGGAALFFQLRAGKNGEYSI